MTGGGAITLTGGASSGGAALGAIAWTGAGVDDGGGVLTGGATGAGVGVLLGDGTGCAAAELAPSASMTAMVRTRAMTIRAARPRSHQ
jgi:hypothetical protein